jgi:hypothetical protein
VLKHYKNENVEVDDKCNNNRLLYLMPSRKFHAKQSEKAT